MRLEGLTLLADDWRLLAEQQRDLGAEAQARTLEWCAERLDEQLREWENEQLTLEQAAAESGYSRDHLSRLVRDDTIPNAGKPHAPRIRRRDLPRKPGTSPGRASSSKAVTSRSRIARTVVNSTLENDDG